MLDFDVAQSRLAAAGKRPVVAETCALHLASGRVLARSVIATLDLPPADNSAMDGYAIRFQDYQPGLALDIQQRCFAGQQPDALQAGKATRLFTGSLLPDGADTIIMQEDCSEADDRLTINEAPLQGAHIRHRGEDVKQGDILFNAGTRIGAAEIATLASQGLASVEVYPQLKIGILSTGDELITPGLPLSSSAQIYNSNGPMLAAMADQLGADVVHVLHAADTFDALHQAFTTLLADCDLVLTVGGVSVGEKDLVKPAIEQLGGSLDLWRVNMKPGKPVALAYANDKPIVCLPGNPVSAFAVFTLLVSPLIRTMQGRSTCLPAVQYGTLSTQAPFHGTREEFLRVQIRHTPQGSTVTPYMQQGSGIISSLAWASGFARIAPNTTAHNGDVVPYYDCQHWLV